MIEFSLSNLRAFDSQFGGRKYQHAIDFFVKCLNQLDNKGEGSQWIKKNKGLILLFIGFSVQQTRSTVLQDALIKAYDKHINKTTREEMTKMLKSIFKWKEIADAFIDNIAFLDQNMVSIFELWRNLS